jgi:uncharacterized protein
MAIEFEWDSRKANRNLRKHGVSFEEAVSAFGDPLGLTIADLHHSDEEDRFVMLGQSQRNRLIVVIFTDRAEKIRIVSARKATPKERRDYEEGP